VSKFTVSRVGALLNEIEHSARWYEDAGRVRAYPRPDSPDFINGLARARSIRYCRNLATALQSLALRVRKGGYHHRPGRLEQAYGWLEQRLMIPPWQQPGAQA